MTTPSADAGYSFEHGVDHCGYGGVAPILCLGGPITPQDFAERDLTTVRGVSVSQGGLPSGVKWQDLNVSYLFSRLREVEYLRISFEDQASLEDLGPLPHLRELIVDCPKVRGTLQGAMPRLRTAHVRWSDECTASMIAPGLEQLTLIRPRFEDLSSVSRLSSLRELDIYYARNLRSLLGLSGFSSLSRLGLHNCPN